MPLDDQTQIAMLRRMLEIRWFEQKAIELYSKGQIAGYLHPSIGQEACAVGAVFALGSNDCILTTHRGHGHCLARGCDAGRMFAELLGRRSGYCRGLGGSMHVTDLSKGVLGAVGIVGGGLPIAVGAALAMKNKNTGGVVLVFFSEGATNIGMFHEALNLAAVWRVPVVFLCENNLYAIATHARAASAVEHVVERAPAYNMPAAQVDGNQVEQVYEQVGLALDRARAGDGPTLIEAMTYKFEGHSVIDPATYRPKEEVEHWRGRCPIKLYRQQLAERGLVDELRADEIGQEVKGVIDDAVRFAIESPMMDAEEFMRDFAPEPA